MSSLIGCHALVFTGEFDVAGIEGSVRRARRAGFDLIEFPLMEPTTFDSAAARRVLDAEGLHVTASLGLPYEADVSSDDPKVVAAGQRLLEVALDRTAEMGGPICAACCTDLCANTWLPRRLAAGRAAPPHSGHWRIEPQRWESVSAWRS